MIALFRRKKKLEPAVGRRVIVSDGMWSTTDGWITEVGDDSWGTQYFRVSGVQTNWRTGTLSWEGHWYTRDNIIKVVE